jgi:potassium efflux system protein
MFKLLQMDWAMFGWIVAALGVGIGFGLQEIVANFVCGIILLFERPIRVGDRVTVDGVVGTVTHIQLRATIITSFDRQDFVVPNKRFITNSILNWTLSGDLNRISVPVSVSPGGDMDSALQILFEAATAHPLVLEDPAPIAVFESFSGGLRNFIVYAFLPELQYRLQVISELHSDIERRFGAAGIEIALPQTQLNLPADSSTAPPASMRGERG